MSHSHQPSLRLSTEGRPTTRLHKRDRYIDSLRSLALIRVMTYHVFGWAWLPILFPSIGIMFALAGSLIASSLDRSPGNPWRVLKKRTIRLLPPVWLFGLVTVSIMLVAGWTHNETSGVPLNWQTLLFWVVPISDPPASTFGNDWVTPLWYIRTYLWFLLLSPSLLWLFRHWPKKMMALPLSVVLLSAIGLLPLEGRSGDVILSICMFGGCWLLGFAHHDNTIRSLPLVRSLLGGVGLMALGLMWAFTHPDPITAVDIGNIPMADTLYCLGAVLILLRLYPDFSWMDKHVVLDKVLMVISSRAMTIYLWGNFAIFLANPLLDRWSFTSSLDRNNALGWAQKYLTSWLIIIVFVFLFGWCEDLAAGRPLKINPWPRTKRQLDTMRTRKVLTFPHPPWMAELKPRPMLIVTSLLLVAAGGVSAVVLAGTNTPGRTATADAPPRYAFNPRPDTTPPANLGQGNGQKLQLSRLLPLSRVSSSSANNKFTKGVQPTVAPSTGKPTATGAPTTPTGAKTSPAPPLLLVPTPPNLVTAPVLTQVPPPPAPGPVVSPPVTFPPTDPAPVPTVPPVTVPPVTVPPPVPAPVPTVPPTVPSVPAPVPTVPPTVPVPVPTVPPTVPVPVPTVPPTVPVPVPTVPPTPVPTVPPTTPVPPSG